MATVRNDNQINQFNLTIQGNIMTISIKGVPRKFDQSELEQQQAGFHSMYRNTDQCCTLVRGDIAYDFLTKVIEMSNEGYILTNKYPISCAPMSYHAHMIKNESSQLADLEAINQRVKQEYIAELQAELTEYRDRLTQQLLEKAVLVEQKKADDKRAKLLAEVEKEVSNVFGELVVVPD
jgi:hypothetical protein